MSSAGNIESVTIIGTGPAGLTAAIYAARANLRPLCVEGEQPGGQLTITSDVENYPGYPEGVMGPELMNQFRKQAERFGTRFVQGKLIKADLSKRPFTLEFSDGQTITSRTVIIATGASAKWLDIPSEKKFLGKGLSACATCDGFFFRNMDIVVVGGGDTAMEEATFLTRFAKSVTVIHRRDKLRASKIMQEKAFRNPKIKFIWDSAIEEIQGDQGVKAVQLRNLKTNETSELQTEGVFIAIGHEPNTHVFRTQLKCDEAGYLLVEPGTTRTNIPGVFAAGDVADHYYRQAITAAGTGCMAAIDAERFLESAE
ncbi:MAG: thioredoxin-disulfide reductase [Oligoflexia bacterium]|nr:thioredoxin-disulfide reductase [Oligoflexia bacterium]